MDLVKIDHSVMIDHYGRQEALDLNMSSNSGATASLRVHEWGMQAFDTTASCRRGSASCIRSIWNTWRVACALDQGGVAYLMTPGGHQTITDDQWHRRRCGWGVGGIEARSRHVGSSHVLPPPDVVGFDSRVQLREGRHVDLVLTVTEISGEKGGGASSSS